MSKGKQDETICLVRDVNFWYIKIRSFFNIHAHKLNNEFRIV